MDIRSLVDESFVPATQRIILKIVGFQHPFWYCESLVHVFHYFYKKLSVYIHIPNKYLECGYKELGIEPSCVRSPCTRRKNGKLHHWCNHLYLSVDTLSLTHTSIQYYWVSKLVCPKLFFCKQLSLVVNK